MDRYYRSFVVKFFLLYSLWLPMMFETSKLVPQIQKRGCIFKTNCNTRAIETVSKSNSCKQCTNRHTNSACSPFQVLCYLLPQLASETSFLLSLIELQRLQEDGQIWKPLNVLGSYQAYRSDNTDSNFRAKSVRFNKP